VRALAVPVLLVLLAGPVGCNSPEATRVRGGAAGGDVGNRGQVELHAGSEIYYKTPLLIPEQARGGTRAAP